MKEQDTIRSLLEKIELDIDFDQIVIFHADDKLDLDKTIWDYNLQDQHKIYEKMKVELQTLSGKKLTVYVIATDTVRKLKKQIVDID